MIRGRRVLVTGGAGYIGSHTAKALHLAGHLPIVFDNLSNGHAEAVQWGPLIEGDVRDRPAVEACIRAHEIDSVIHFAGLIEVGRSFSEPAAFWDANLAGVASVLGAMRATDVRRIVFSSTAAVYGQPAEGSLQPLAETLPALPINPYGETKLAAERMIAAFARAYGLTGVALRYFNASGADPEGLIGEAHDPESHLIPLAIEAALGSGPPLTVFGADFPTPDGSCVRDYVHVADLASAHVMALDAEVGPERFAAMNLGLGRGVSVLQVIEAVGKSVGRPVPYRVGPRRLGDPACLVADPGKASAVLGWRPAYTVFRDLVDTATAWRLSPGRAAIFPRISS